MSIRFTPFGGAARAAMPIALTALLLSGCASMNESECRQADWLARGLADGRSGSPESVLDDHTKACAKAGVVPDGRRWQQGWALGVVDYCRPASAWKAGSSGHYYHGVCRAHDEGTFRRFYVAGQELHRQRMEFNRVGRDVNKGEEDLKKAKTDEERKSIRDRIQSLDRERARIRRTIESLELAAPPP